MARKLNSHRGEGFFSVHYATFIQQTFIFLSIILSLSPIRLLYSVKEPEPVLVFEDVTQSGYGLSSGPLNIDGTKFVASKLAKFHAASVYLDRDVSKFFIKFISL